VVVNSVFQGDKRASLMVQSGGSALVTSSTFFNDTGVGALRVLGGSLQLEHVIAWGGPDQAFANAASSLLASYCDVQIDGSGLPGTGNFEADPLFVNVAAGDLHLAPGSPCIDAGNPLAAPIGSDFERDSRMLDGDLDGVVRLDLGADEHARLHLEVLGTPAPGNTLTFVTTGTAFPSAVLAIGRPGTLYFPRAGTVFVRAAGSFRSSWPAPPSSTSMPVPLGVSGLFHAQVLAFGGGALALSNYVPLEL